MPIDIVKVNERGGHHVTDWQDGVTHARVTWRATDAEPGQRDTWSEVYDSPNALLAALSFVDTHVNLELVAADLEPFTTPVGTPEGTRNPQGEMVYNIPQHKRDDGRFCGWSSADTKRDDRQCPDRCASIAPEAESTDCKHCGARGHSADEVAGQRGLSATEAAFERDNPGMRAIRPAEAEAGS